MNKNEKGMNEPLIIFAKVEKCTEFTVLNTKQKHMCDLESDLNALTCALQLAPFFSHCPLKKAQRAGHWFTLMFIEHGSGAAVLSSCGFVAVGWVQSWFALELANCDP